MSLLAKCHLTRVDRVYLSSGSVIAVFDHEKKRTFVIRKGLPDVVVWNPVGEKIKNQQLSKPGFDPGTSNNLDKNAANEGDFLNGKHENYSITAGESATPNAPNAQPAQEESKSAEEPWTEVLSRSKHSTANKSPVVQMANATSKRSISPSSAFSDTSPVFNTFKSLGAVDEIEIKQGPLLSEHKAGNSKKKRVKKASGSCSPQPS
ncbi:hypothetical protein POM88_005639 [Heracleum sosnowskyi]|uniref:Uncharacterized protein n=1 Tax=Heracleum sosnowskyi TaxID=360622 RepID=A0AAD8N4M2_9APIA|nr:hypothetical protein POM88_005639 [Heracleum sosnowskyi]